MSSIYDWSTTAANNGTADADTPWPEGMARRQVNDSARNMMKRNAEFIGDIGGALSAGGTANGLTVTANSAFTTYADGRIVSFRATASNTGAATLSVNAIGAKAIRKMDPTGDVALAANDIRINGIYVAQYSAALNGAAGAWLLINPTFPADLVGGASSSTDNAIARWNGTTGRVIQNSGVIIDDTNSISGVVNFASGAITQSVAGISNLLVKNTSDSVDVRVTASSAGVGGFIGTQTNHPLILATNNTTAVTISTAGAMTTAGALTAGGALTVSSGGITATNGNVQADVSFVGEGNVILATTGANTAFVRPNGFNSTVGQFTVDSAGDAASSGSMSVGNDLTVTDDIFCGVTALINPAAAEYGMSVDAGGLLTVSRNADLPLRVKRNGDGTLVAWYNGTTNIAVVSQAADLVTYGTFCGAHWAQWAGTAPVGVLRGTILETVDEMCLWEGEANSTLPKVKVSDTTGAKRVYGVYSHPDSEDPDRDFHVAALGAHPIRIAAGAVVQNGDLLESNGDGCARVQESEVFTSRTIAKVTSSAVVETYPDGSYLVPCTLHCG